jgi:hypothetical protein
VGGLCAIDAGGRNHTICYGRRLTRGEEAVWGCVLRASSLPLPRQLATLYYAHPWIKAGWSSVARTCPGRAGGGVEHATCLFRLSTRLSLPCAS